MFSMPKYHEHFINICSQQITTYYFSAAVLSLTHWGRVTHICVSKLTIIGSDNGSSPGRRQAIIWTNDGILLTGPLGTNFSENLIEILTLSFTKVRLKVSSAKWRPICLGLNVLSLMILALESLYVVATCICSYKNNWNSYNMFNISRCTCKWKSSRFRLYTQDNRPSFNVKSAYNNALNDVLNVNYINVCYISNSSNSGKK